MRRLPPLNALRSFEAAGRLGSLTLAAEELHVTPSAVAQQIRALESFLGQKLFERDGRALRLAPRAQHYLADVADAIGRLTQVTEQMLCAPGRRPLRINTSTSFAHGWLFPRLADFHAAHPGIDLQVVPTPDRDIETLDETSDVLIRRYTPELRRRGFVCRPLLANAAVPVCAPGHPALASIHVPSDLQGAPLLHYAGLPSAWQYWFHCAGTPVGATLRGPLYEEFLLLLQAAISGLGICLAPRAVVQDHIAHGRLVALFPEVRLEGPPFHCLYRDDARDQSLGRLVDWIFQRAVEEHGPVPA